MLSFEGYAQMLRTLVLTKPLDIVVKDLITYWPKFRHARPTKNFMHAQELILNGQELILNDEYVNPREFNKMQVLILSDKRKDGYHAFASALSKEELAVLLNQLPSEILSKFISSLKGTVFDVSRLVPKLRHHFIFLKPPLDFPPLDYDDKTFSLSLK
jgi:hypothetical protein